MCIIYRLIEKQPTPQFTNVKQAIIIRKDLNMRRGKEIAQGSHASMEFVLQHHANNTKLTDVEQYWVDNHKIKICLSVTSEDELINLYKEAKKHGLKANLVTDLGLTEFSKPTVTCLAIGPDEGTKISVLTKSLKLY